MRMTGSPPSVRKRIDLDFIRRAWSAQAGTGAGASQESQSALARSV